MLFIFELDCPICCSYCGRCASSGRRVSRRDHRIAAWCAVGHRTHYKGNDKLDSLYSNAIYIMWQTSSEKLAMACRRLAAAVYPMRKDRQRMFNGQAVLNKKVLILFNTTNEMNKNWQNDGCQRPPRCFRNRRKVGADTGQSWVVHRAKSCQMAWKVGSHRSVRVLTPNGARAHIERCEHAHRTV